MVGSAVLYYKPLNGKFPLRLPVGRKSDPLDVGRALRLLAGNQASGSK